MTFSAKPLPRGLQLDPATGRITDSWESIDSIGFSQHGREIVVGPGHLNDCAGSWWECWGADNDGFRISVARHGVSLIRVSAPQR